MPFLHLQFRDVVRERKPFPRPTIRTNPLQGTRLWGAARRGGVGVTSGLSALEPLVDLLTPTELRRVAASLEAAARPRRAAREAAPEHQDITPTLPAGP